MKHIYIFVIILILKFVFISCETNPPNSPIISNDFGYIFVTSNIDSAAIILDNEFTGKYTPDTIKTSEGTHIVQLIKSGFSFNDLEITVIKNQIKNVLINAVNNQINKIVLLEDFANVSCDPCVISNKILRRVVSKYSGNVIVAKFSTNFPSPNDPFYLRNKLINNERMEFYNILFAPSIIVDGITRPIPTDSTEMFDAIENRLSEITPFEFTIEDSSKNEDLFLSINIKLLEIQFNYSDCRVFVAILEEKINFDNPPGSNGETVFYDIVNYLTPIKSGIDLKFSNGNFSETIYIERNSEWILSNNNFIGFIQDINTKEVYQASLTK